MTGNTGLLYGSGGGGTADNSICCGIGGIGGRGGGGNGFSTGCGAGTDILIGAITFSGTSSFFGETGIHSLSVDYKIFSY